MAIERYLLGHIYSEELVIAVFTHHYGRSFSPVALRAAKIIGKEVRIFFLKERFSVPKQELPLISPLLLTTHERSHTI